MRRTFFISTVSYLRWSYLALDEVSPGRCKPLDEAIISNCVSQLSSSWPSDRSLLDVAEPGGVLDDDELLRRRSVAARLDLERRRSAAAAASVSAATGPGRMASGCCPASASRSACLWVAAAAVAAVAAPWRASSPPPLRAARVAGSFSIRDSTNVIRCIRVAWRVGRACATPAPEDLNIRFTVLAETITTTRVRRPIDGTSSAASLALGPRVGPRVGPVPSQPQAPHRHRGRLPHVGLVQGSLRTLNIRRSLRLENHVVLVLGTQQNHDWMQRSPTSLTALFISQVKSSTLVRSNEQGLLT